MKLQKTTPIEVVRIFYLNNELLKEVFKTPNKEKLNKNIKKIINKAKKLSKIDLINYHLDNWHPRYDNYFNSKWEIKEILIKDCGAWPKTGGLSYEATKDSVLETANFIKPYLKDKNKLSLRTSRFLYIEEMMKYVEEINKYIPIIVLEDGVIRNNKFDKTLINKNYKKCKYDIDDGNHRAIAYALLGKKKIKAFVGKRIYKCDILYH